MRRTIAIAILVWLPLSGALADVYRSVDAQGHVQYSDTPTPGAELIRMNNGRAPIRSTPVASANTAKPTSLAQSGDQVHQQLEQEAAARSVQNDVAQTRADQCKKATDAYNGSVQARRIYKTGPNGEHEFLTDDEADKQRLTYKMQMDSACQGQ
jgi:Domain of unknown function (DUF4124)